MNTKQSKNNSVWMIVWTPNNLEITVFEWFYECMNTKQSRYNSGWMIVWTPNNLEITVFECLYEHQTI